MEMEMLPAEQFQNETLRPILKARNDLLVALFRHYIHKRKVSFDSFSIEDKAAYIKRTIQKDLNFRSLLLGTIVGHFTVAQFDIYCQWEEELSRRTINMLIQRLQNQLASKLSNPAR